MKTIYCPYSDKEIDVAESSSEHIIPLALGGSNQFVIPVQKDLNSRLGSKIDGKLSNDFLIMFGREKFDAKGHSGITPVPIVKKAKDSATGTPLQVTMGKELRIWDAKQKKYVTNNGQTFEASISIGMDLPIQFVAKTALSAGYFVYGNLFRDHVRHQDLRVLMRGPLGLSKEEIRSVKTKVYGRFQGNLIGKNNTEFQIQKTIAESVRGSCVVLVPGKDCLGIYVGILGNYLGMVNIPANTTNFPRYDEHDLGHTIFLIDGVMKRRSYRSRLKELYKGIGGE